MTNPNCDEGRRSVVAGGLRELASCSQREGVCLPERANQNDADALEDPAKRAPSSQDFVQPGSSPRTTLRGGLAPDVRPGRCAYCGRPCNGRTCAGHADLPELDEHLLLTSAIYRLRTLGAQHSPVDRSVETVDRPNGLRYEQARP